MIKKASHNHGYTLIELAMVTLIVGLIMGSGITAYKIYRTDRDMALTETAKVRINLALNAFRERYGRYPCPASYTAQRGTPEYGRAGDCSNLSVPPGQCAQGICVEQSIAGRTVTLEDGTVVTPRVRRGAIPYRELNLSEDEFYDQYGGRFSYAVTELLTDEDTFNINNGGIHVVDGQLPTPQSLLETPGSALYFLFSHGPDNVGAYGRNGVLISQCTGPMFDVENCNTSDTDSTAVYRYAQRSDMPVENGGFTMPSDPTPGAVNANRHYDDVAYYKGSDPTPLFKFSELAGNRDNAYDLQDAARIVIGNTTNDEKVNVEGSVRASEQYITQLICNEEGEDCFSPEKIGGSGMHCPEGFYADGVHGGGVGGALTCREPMANADCDGGFITGFANGAVVCDRVSQTAMCPQRNVTVCGVRHTLRASAHDTRITVTGGVSQVQIWRCNDGTWVRQSSRGVCTCTPRTVTTRNSCGTGYNGQTTVETTTVCPSGQQTVRTNRSECTCASGTSTRTLDCPEGQSGSITETRTTTCSGNVATTTAWRVTGNTCSCAAQAPQTRNGICPSGTEGDVTERRTWNTGTCSWEAWTVTSNTCACVDSTETRNVACPTGQTGTIRQRRNTYCNGTPPSAWVEISNTCNVPPTCRWSNSGAGMTSGNAGPYVGDICVCGTRNGPCKVRIPGGVQGYTGCQCN